MESDVAVAAVTCIRFIDCGFTTIFHRRRYCRLREKSSVGCSKTDASKRCVVDYGGISFLLGVAVAPAVDTTMEILARARYFNRDSVSDRTLLGQRRNTTIVCLYDCGEDRPIFAGHYGVSISAMDQT